MRLLCGLVFVAVLALAGCGAQQADTPRQGGAPENSASPEKVAATTGAGERTETPRPTTTEDRQDKQETTAPDRKKEDPPPANVYAGTTGTKVKDSVAGIPERVYVPNSGDGTVDVIDPKTFRVVDSYAVGSIPHHVTPSYDLSELYVNNEESGLLTVIDPKSGKPSGTIQTPYPYNLYFTPDGKKAIVVVERLQTIEFRDPKSWKLLGSVYVPSPGVDHMDFSANGDYFLASSEWGGTLTKVDVNQMKVTGTLEVGGAPVDVKLSPDGSVFYVANQGPNYNGVHVVDAKTMKEIKFIPTGAGAHGLYPSRDAKSLYVSNRLEGSISVIDFETREVREKWNVGGSPDMFQLSPDGSQLWYADRYNGTVSVVDTGSGELLQRIQAGVEPHGITYFPNVGRFSLGHNGVYR